MLLRATFQPMMSRIFYPTLEIEIDGGVVLPILVGVQHQHGARRDRCSGAVFVRRLGIAVGFGVKFGFAVVGETDQLCARHSHAHLRGVFARLVAERPRNVVGGNGRIALIGHILGQ